MGRLVCIVASAVLLLGLAPGQAEQGPDDVPVPGLPAALPGLGQANPPNGNRPAQTAQGLLSVFVVLDGVASGPHDREALLTLREDHSIWPDTLMWMEGQDGWAAIRETAAVSDLLWSPDAPTDTKAMRWLAGDWESLPHVGVMPGKGQAQLISLMTIEPSGWLKMYNKKVQLNTTSPTVEVAEYSGKATAFYVASNRFLLFSNGTLHMVVGGKAGEPEKIKMMVLEFTILGPARMIDVGGVTYRRVE